MKRIARLDPSEAQVQSAILDYLAAERILAFRMNTGIADFAGRKVSFGVPGMADILAFPHAWRDDNPYMLVIVPLWLECKAKDGRQTPLQKSFQAQVESHGHRYIIARSIEDVKDALR